MLYQTVVQDASLPGILRMVDAQRLWSASGVWLPVELHVRGLSEADDAGVGAVLGS